MQNTLEYTGTPSGYMSPSGYISPRGGNVTMGSQSLSTILMSPRGQSPSFAGDGGHIFFHELRLCVSALYQCVCINGDAGDLVHAISLTLGHTSQETGSCRHGVVPCNPQDIAHHHESLTVLGFPPMRLSSLGSLSEQERVVNSLRVPSSGITRQGVVAYRPPVIC